MDSILDSPSVAICELNSIPRLEICTHSFEFILPLIQTKQCLRTLFDSLILFNLNVVVYRCVHPISNEKQHTLKTRIKKTYPPPKKKTLKWRTKRLHPVNAYNVLLSSFLSSILLILLFHDVYTDTHTDTHSYIRIYICIYILAPMNGDFNLTMQKWNCNVVLTHCGRVTQICVFTLQLLKTDDANLRF